MDDIFKLLLASSSFVLLFGLVSRYIKNRLFLSESIVSMIAGIVIGDSVLGIFNINNSNSEVIMYHFSRIILCVQTMAVAMSLPKNYVIKKWQSIFFFVIVIGITKCVFSFGLIYLVCGYNATDSWILAACITPTDPILSSSIIRGKFATRIAPKRVRLLLSAESGMNDGLGIVLLSAGLGLSKNGVEDGLILFFMDSILTKVFLSAIVGLTIGVLSRGGLKYCYVKRLVGVESFLAHWVVLMVFSLAFMELLGGSELICIFFAGIMFSFDEWFILETRNSKLQEITEAILGTSFFFFFGSKVNLLKFTMPIIVVSLIIIFVRRPLVCFALGGYVSELRTNREILFVGWFGPIGVGALYYALFTRILEDSFVFDFVNCTVFLSVLIHGLTVPICSKLIKKENFQTNSRVNHVEIV